jgi:hypothetical protein
MVLGLRFTEPLGSFVRTNRPTIPVYVLLWHKLSSKASNNLESVELLGLKRYNAGKWARAHIGRTYM